MVEERQFTLIAYRNKLLLANRTKEPSNYRLSSKAQYFAEYSPSHNLYLPWIHWINLGSPLARERGLSFSS